MVEKQKTLFDNFINENTKQSEINNDFLLTNKITYHLGETNTFLNDIADETVHLIVTSPPYNIGKEYEKKKDIKSYLDTQKEVIQELTRVLHPKGSICWQVGNYIKDKEVYPLDIFYYQIFKELGLQLRNRIIWHFGHGLHCKLRFSGRYETLLWFTKNDDYTFNLDPVRVPSKYPGKRHHKGKKKGQISGNPLGKNPSDIWEFVAKEWDLELWDIPNVKSNHPEKTVHPCQFPIELVERCVLAFTNENDFILDPYAGVGSALLAGIKHNRKVIGVEKEKDYIEVGKQRIKDFFLGNLKYRPLGKQVYKPNGKTQVSKVPSEWLEDQNSLYHTKTKT